MNKLFEKIMAMLDKMERKRTVDNIEEVETLDEVPTIDGKIVLENLSEYRDLLKQGITEFDFSKLDMCGEDIQQIDLSGLNLTINLQEIFIPFGGRCKFYNATLSSIFHWGEDFICLDHSNLKGNHVIGELCNAIGEGYYHDKISTFIYSEDTFDDEYKTAHPKYFLDATAPSELKEKYYMPRAKVESVFSLSDGYEERTVYYRQRLTFEEYLQYYQFLHGKYLERFRIPTLDYSKIKLVEVLGLEQAKQIFESLKTANIHPDLFLSSIGKMTTQEIIEKVLGNNEPPVTELLEQIDTVIDNRQKKIGTK